MSIKIGNLSIGHLSSDAMTPIGWLCHRAKPDKNGYVYVPKGFKDELSKEDNKIKDALESGNSFKLFGIELDRIIEN